MTCQGRTFVSTEWKKRTRLPDRVTYVSRSPPETQTQGAGTDSHGWTWEDPDCRLEPVAPPPWRWRDLGFLFEFRHVGVVALRVTISHSGRALVPENKGQRMSFLGSMISLIPPCIQPPDCQRFAIVYANSHSAHSYIQARGSTVGLGFIIEGIEKGHRQSDQHLGTVSNKGNIGETPERRGGAHMGFHERIDTILN